MVVRLSTPFGLGRNGLLASRGSQLPRALPINKPFFRRLFFKQTQKGSTHLFKINRLFFLLFSCLSVTCILILLLLMMSGNVQPNPATIFSCSMCSGNVTWSGRPMQCCTCPKWVGSRYSLLSFSRFKNLGSSHSGAVLFAVSLLLLEIPKLRTLFFVFRVLPFVYLHCSTRTIWPPQLMQHSRSTLAFKLLTFLPPT